MKRNYRILQIYPRGTAPLMRCYVTSRVLIELGERPYVANALWDTGSTNSAVSPRLAKALGLEFLGFRHVQTANSPNERVAMFDGLFHAVKGMPFGPFKVDVVTLDLDDTPEVNRLDMIIGMDFISIGRFTLSAKDEDSYDFSFEISESEGYKKT